MPVLETTRLVLRSFADNDLDSTRGKRSSISLVHSDNIRSRRVAEKNGMTPARETVFRAFSTIVFSILGTQPNGS